MIKMSATYLFFMAVFIPYVSLKSTCPQGSIAVDSDGVCINRLKVDFLSTTDATIIQMTAGEISVTDITIQGDLDISVFTSAGVVHNDSSGTLSTSLIVDADIDTAAAIADTKLATISTAGKVSNSATTAASTNIASAIVARDESGNFGTNMISLTGTTTNSTDVATKAYVDATVGGTSLNTPNTAVRRDNAGSFAAQIVSVVDTVASRNLILSTGTSTSTAGNIMKGSNRFIHNLGTSNTFVGVNAGNFSTTGTGQNSALGTNALTANTTGANNVACGYNCLSGCTTGSSNVAIGSGAGSTLTTGSNNVYISSAAGSASESGVIRIGTSGVHTACYLQGLTGLALSLSGVVVDSSNGKLGYLLSSEKFKKNIKDMANASSDILKLHPVTFTYKEDETDTQQFGLIAEEVDRVFPAIVVRDENGEPKTVQYHVLPVLLLNEMQKQQLTIDQIQVALAHLQGQIQEFIRRVNTIENRR